MPGPRAGTGPVPRLARFAYELGAESVADGYLRGLRDGGWTASADAVRTAIAACGAAKLPNSVPMSLDGFIAATAATASYSATSH